MDRVVRWIDSLIADGTIDEAVIQAAAFGERPRRASAIGIVGTDELDRLMRSASRIVTHGGPGSILQVLAMRRRPIVIPRDPALGEHVDRHQQRFVAWLASRRDIIPVASIEELRATLLAPETAATEARADQHAVERLRGIIHG